MARTRTGRKKLIKIDWDKVEWGDKTNTELAREIGCAPNTVAYRRKKLGIPYPDGGRFDNRAQKGIDWDQHPLGKIPDTQLAKILGVHPTSVQLARKRRGIPASGHKSIPELREEVAMLHGLLRETRDALLEANNLDDAQVDYRDLLARIEEVIG